jgi:dephospho-CoA kinase
MLKPSPYPKHDPPDIPLLFETRAEGACDVVAVVSAPEGARRARVMARPGMTVEKMEAIIARQVRFVGLFCI